jgi:zinc transporter
MTSPLVHGFLFDAGGQAGEATLEGLAAVQPGQARYWAHLDATNPSSKIWLRQHGGLPPLIIDALLADETRPRAVTSQQGLLLVLRGVNLNPGADAEDMVSIRMWVKPGRLVSTRRRRLLSVEDTVATLQDQPISGIPELMIRICGRMINRISDVVGELEERMAELEESLLEEAAPTMRSRLAQLRRESIALRRYLAPQRDALLRLQTDSPEFFSDLDRQHVREINDRMLRVVEDLDAVRERAMVVHEELVSSLSDQLNKRMYLLSIVAALFLPLGFLTGLLGINVGGIPGADSPMGFWIFAGLLAVLLSLQVWFFIRKKWF